MFAKSLGDDGAELRPLEPWNAEEFLAHMDRGREHIGRFVELPDHVTDLPSATSFLQRYADKAAADSGRLYGIWADGTLVGGVMFRIFDAAAGNCEAGCWLEPTSVGRGLITRALRLMIDWAVEERGMHRVEWVAGADNTASLNVARRLGMVREGVLRESYLYRGVRHDEEVWAVLAPEWRRLREAPAARRLREAPAARRPREGPAAPVTDP
ncbi:GNAT family N-acetyltransferase [Streptomyces agglomeratus]|uniref:GNAT family N-acetyltransferase n=1 Tax=Streptomyces agglomeratus TaxID=285458 RepID=UPI00086F509C|nr:GNAT family protein [Streptomyces agglomeratus]OEJ60634.1 GNAT family N-acetyltransferase [Streptomyces agglomeratus]